MSGNSESGSPVRLPIRWQEAGFHDRDSLDAELERIYDICHGCRRCVNLCKAFPTLFDLIDESATMEVDGVDKADYGKVVKECYLCDLCYMTKCPYVPPHEWNVDFPHLMLRAKMTAYREQGLSMRDRLLGYVDEVGRMASWPGMSEVVNRGLNAKTTRRVFRIHPEADLPRFHSRTFRSRFSGRAGSHDGAGKKVALFVTCYGNYNMPDVMEKLCAVLEHNGVEIAVTEKERCCGMPRLEQGHLEEVEKLKDRNVPQLFELVGSGYEIIAPVPSCVLMFRQELPLLFPGDEQVAQVAEHIHDPAAWLLKLDDEAALNKDFKHGLGRVAYHAACHTRVQNVGLKTRKMLELIPGTQVTTIERCSGHDGTYAVKAESYEKAVQIARPAARMVDRIEPDHFTSDCVLAGRHIARTSAGKVPWSHPMELLAKAYGM